MPRSAVPRRPPAAARRLRAALAGGAVAATALLGAGLPAAAGAQGPAADAVADSLAPTLVVFVSVDQLRGDYLDRFAPTLTGGLARLAREGAWYSDAYQDHANTETAPGHAGPLSGRYPRSHGIVLNSAGVPDAQAPLLGGGGPGASPFRFRGTALIDWMRLADARSRALSVSRKDRGAILPLGRAKQSAFWYAGDGRFTTSTYYADTLPAWVQQFNARRSAAALAGRIWTPLLDDGAYPERDSVPEERPGQPPAGYMFPYALSNDPDTAAMGLPNTPWMDSLTIDLALEGVQALGLGTGPQPDLLVVSLSTTDAVGHTWGPDSKELHDQVVRMDRELGRFLDSLFTIRDPRRVVLALTADHGVGPLPGVPSRDPNRRGMRVDVYGPYRAMRDALTERGVGFAAFAFNDGELRLDRADFARAGVNADSVVDVFLREMRKVPGVLRADRYTAFARADTARDVIARRYVHMYPADLAPEAVVTLTPYSVWGDASYSQHGSPHDYDAHVPVIFWGAPFRAGRITERAAVVDIAPTLARVLDVAPLERLDGRVLEGALKDRR